MAQTLNNNQLLVRVLEKQRDRNMKWLTQITDVDANSANQQLPEIECINFDRYEETWEERN